MSLYFPLLVTLATASVLAVTGCMVEPTFAYQEPGLPLIVDVPTSWEYGVDEGKRRLCYGTDKGSRKCQTLVMWAGLLPADGEAKGSLEIRKISNDGKYIELAELFWETLISPQNTHNDRLVVHGYGAVFLTRTLLEDKTHWAHLHIRADDAHWIIDCNALPGPHQATATTQCKNIIDSVRFSSASLATPLDSDAHPELTTESEGTIAYQEPGVPLTVNIPMSWEYGLARRDKLRGACSKSDNSDLLCQAIVMWAGVMAGNGSADLQFPQFTVLKVIESSHFRRFADLSASMKSQLKYDFDELVRRGITKRYDLTERMIDSHEAVLLYEQRTNGVGFVA